MTTNELNRLIVAVNQRDTATISAMLNIDAKEALKIVEEVATFDATALDVLKGAIYCGIEETLTGAIERAKDGDFFILSYLNDHGHESDGEIGQMVAEGLGIADEIALILKREYSITVGGATIDNYINIDVEKLGRDWRLSHGYYEGVTGFVYFED